MTRNTMASDNGRAIFNTEKMILHILHLEKKEVTKDVVIAAYHAENSNRKQK